MAGEYFNCPSAVRNCYLNFLIFHDKIPPPLVPHHHPLKVSPPASCARVSVIPADHRMTPAQLLIHTMMQEEEVSHPTWVNVGLLKAIQSVAEGSCPPGLCT